MVRIGRCRTGGLPGSGEIIQHTVRKYLLCYLGNDSRVRGDRAWPVCYILTIRRTKSQVVLPVILSGLVLPGLLLAGPAFAAPVEKCDPFHLSLSCDLSSWTMLILGDILITVTLAIFLHYLSRRSNIRLEQNSQAIKETNAYIQKILTDQQGTRQRRQTYVVQAFKNHFGSLLLCIGLVSKFSGTPEKSARQIRDLESILQRSRNTLNLSIDVIDPMLIEEIEKFLAMTERAILEHVQDQKPLDYDKLKSSIENLAGRLNKHSDSAEVLK